MNQIKIEELNNSFFRLKYKLENKYKYIIERILNLSRLDLDNETYLEQFENRELYIPTTVYNGSCFLFSKKGDNIYLPIGFKSEIIEIIKNYKFIELIVKEIDKEIIYFNKDEYSKGLRDFQVEAVEKILTQRFLTIKLPTGSGKTHIAFELINITRSNTKTNILYLVDTITLLHQTYNKLIEKISSEEIGLIGDGNFNISKKITICLTNSIYSRLKGKNKENILKILNFLKEVRVLIVDEPQNVLSKMNGYLTACLCKNKIISVGLSATPWTNTGKDAMIYGQTGKIKYDKSEIDLICNSYICKPSFKIYDIPKVNLSTTSLNRYKRLKNTISSTERHGIFKVLDSEIIINNEFRNNLISEIVVDHIKKDSINKPILIIVRSINNTSKNKSHASILKEKISKKNKDVKVEILSSRLSTIKRTKIIKQIEEGCIDVVIVTSKLFGTGIDIPRLNCLVFAHETDKKNNILQAVGRIIRKTESKIEKPLIIDFRDNTLYYQKHSEKRLEIYKETYKINNNELEEIDYFKSILVDKYSKK